MNRILQNKLRTSLIAGSLIVGSATAYTYSPQTKELLAKATGQYITRNSRFTVVFEEAGIQGSWNRLSFKRCFVSRRPKTTRHFMKGSQKVAALNAENDRKQEAEEAEEAKEHLDDGNYTQYDLTIDEILIEVSFSHWLNGKGILKEASLNGIRGVVDRTHVHWDPSDDPRNYLNVPSPGDFDIGNFRMSDLLVTLYQPDNFRPFNISIFDCHLDRLRQNWLMLDFLTATHINGSYDGSLFTINRLHQQHPDHVTRCRISGLNVDHLNTGIEGPFGWIVHGTVDMVGDVRVPNHTLKVHDFLHLLWKEIGRSAKHGVSYETEYSQYYKPNDKFKLDLNIRLNNVKARINHNEISYINYALMGPIVGYINSRKTYMEVLCHIVKPIGDFNGSWTVYDSKLMDDISTEVYNEFGNFVIDQDQKSKRLKKIGFWALQFVLQVVLVGLSGIG